MDVLNKLVQDLLSKGAIQFSGAITVGLRKDAIKIKGEIPATILDVERPNQVKTLASLIVPIEATVAVAPVTFPITTLR